MALAVEDGRREDRRDRVVDAADERAVEGDADHGGQEALGDAVRHVHAVGLAPLRHDVAVADDDAGEVAARLQGPVRRVEGLAPEGARVVRALEVARLGSSRSPSRTRWPRRGGRHRGRPGRACGAPIRGRASRASRPGGRERGPRPGRGRGRGCSWARIVPHPVVPRDAPGRYFAAMRAAATLSALSIPNCAMASAACPATPLYDDTQAVPGLRAMSSQ